MFHSIIIKLIRKCVCVFVYIYGNIEITKSPSGYHKFKSSKISYI